MKKSVEDVIEERHITHGDFEETFSTACRLLEALTGNSLKPHEFALVNIIHKIARIKCGGYHEDHWNDIEGYARLGKILHSDAQATEIVMNISDPHRQWGETGEDDGV